MLEDTAMDVTSESSAETSSDVTSAPSTDTVDNGVTSYLGAIDQALGEKTEESPASKEADSKESVSEVEKPKDPFEMSEAEKRQLTASQQHRIRELAEVTRNAKAEVETVRQEVESLKPKAERMDELSNYMQQHDISTEHLNNALGLTAMINAGKLDQAIPVLKALLQECELRAGDVLPEELRTRVQYGYISEQDAKRMHKAETARAAEFARMQQTEQRRQQQEQSNAVQQLVNSVARTADAWTSEQQTSDPDWNLKRDIINEQVELILRRNGPDGYPRTEKATRELLNKVKQDVEQRIGKFRPAVKAINPPVTGSAASHRSAAKPGSYLDAIEIGLSMPRN